MRLLPFLLIIPLLITSCGGKKTGSESATATDTTGQPSPVDSYMATVDSLVTLIKQTDHADSLKNIRPTFSPAYGGEARRLNPDYQLTDSDKIRISQGLQSYASALVAAHKRLRSGTDTTQANNQVQSMLVDVSHNVGGATTMADIYSFTPPVPSDLQD